MHTTGVSSNPQLTSLSRRELEVLSMTATGRTNVEIATAIGVTVHAVKFHLASVYKKLGVANRTEAAAFYLLERVPPGATS